MKYITAILTTVLLAFIFSCHKDPPIPTPQSRVTQQASGPPAIFHTSFDTAMKTASVTISNGTITITSADTPHMPCGVELWVGLKFKAHDTGTYPLSYSNKGTGYYGDPCLLGLHYNYSTDSTHTGIITLTAYDTINHLLSGHYKFDGFYYFSPYQASDTATFAFTGTFSNLHW